MVKKYFLLFYFIVVLVAVSTVATKAQTVIGMGTEQPNPNAVLELVPEQGNQGFLAPRLTSAQRTASSFTGKLTSADHGLLVFDVTLGKFYYWFDGAWREGTSGETGGPTPGVSGTTWYTGNAAPDGVDAAEGDFYINESTGEVFKFSGNAFVSMGSIKGGPAANSPNLSSVLQQGSSASNQKITDLGTPTEDNDAATKAYVDDRETVIKTYVDQEILTVPGGSVPSLEQVLIKDANSNDAGGKQIVGLGNPTADNHAATKAYVDNHTDADNQSLENVLNEGNTANNNYQIKGLIDPTEPQDAATKAYVDNKVITAQPPPGLGTVLGVSSDANGRITNLSTPTSPNDAATKAYVDGRDLEDILNAGNDAGNNQITNLASPTADGHATNRKYVDDQDNAVSVSSKITDFSFNDNTNILNLTEGSAPPYTVDLNHLKNGTPAALPAGELFVGNSSGASQAMKITGDISIDAAGVATITNLIITTDKIANAAVTKEKINANVAGNGLSKNTTDGSIEINAGNGLSIDSDQIRITPFPDGWIGVGQGLSNNMDFKEVQRDATLNKDGELTVKGLQGRPIATTAPSNNEVLQYNGGQWAPAALPPGGGGLPALPNGRLFIGNNGNQPTPTTISGDITIDANGTATIAADAVDQTKINPNVAGAGLSQAGDGSLRVNLGGDVTTGGGGSNLTVIKLQGNQVATTPPNANGQVLTWNGSQWAPASLPPGGGSQQWYAGADNPNTSNPSGSQDGDYYLHTITPAGNETVYRKVGGSWQELGGFTSTGDVRLNGRNYSYRTPWLYTGSDKPDGTNPDVGKMGDLYYDDDEEKLYIKADDNKWKGL